MDRYLLEEALTYPIDKMYDETVEAYDGQYEAWQRAKYGTAEYREGMIACESNIARRKALREAVMTIRDTLSKLPIFSEEKDPVCL